MENIVRRFQQIYNKFDVFSQQSKIRNMILCLLLVIIIWVVEEFHTNLLYYNFQLKFFLKQKECLPIFNY